MHQVLFTSGVGEYVTPIRLLRNCSC